MNNRIDTYLLILAAAISIVTAMTHLSCLILGPQCYAAQMAPKVIITSAQNGTMFAPIANIMISSLFIICGIYALSAAKVIRT